jgi:ABC-2 type transport system permease protein
MSTITTATSIDHSRLHNAKPDFVGLLRGELFKISRRWMTWLLLVPLLGAITMLHLLRATNTDTKELIAQGQLGFYYDLITQSLSMLRAFGGIYLIILTAFVFGLEFQYGTIRILLSRGVGRVQLLLAKLVSLLLIALIVVIGGMLYLGALTIILTAIATGSLNALHVLTPDFWHNMGTYFLLLLLNMTVTILMVTALCTLTRSLAMGLAVALIWFPADNIGSIFMQLGYKVTHSTIWLGSTQYFLGPNLNVMVSLILPLKVRAYALGVPPLVKVDGSHTLWIASIYSLIFLAAALILTWKRDVKE